MKQKKFKVQYRSRATSRNYVCVPMIQITGKWLEALGYEIGDTIFMEYDETGIHIRPLTETEKAEEEKASIERELRRKQKELDDLQKQVDKGRQELNLVAERNRPYSSAQAIH